VSHGGFAQDGDSLMLSPILIKAATNVAGNAGAPCRWFSTSIP
jgi:hypothetical protein